MKLYRFLVLSSLIGVVCALAACGGSHAPNHMPLPLMITTTQLPAGSVNVPYNGILSASGGSGAFTWSISSGALPPGLMLNPQQGLITGTPTAAGSYPFTAHLVDTSNDSAN